MSENTPEGDPELRHELDLSEGSIVGSGSAELIGLEPGDGFEPPSMEAEDYEGDRE